jgi:hypothetical protein
MELQELLDLIDDLSYDLSEAWSQLGEIEAEHRNETALFGDSWPGAQIEIGRSRKAMLKSEDVLDGLCVRLDAEFPVAGPQVTEVPAALYHDSEPF